MPTTERNKKAAAKSLVRAAAQPACHHKLRQCLLEQILKSINTHLAGCLKRQQAYFATSESDSPRALVHEQPRKPGSLYLRGLRLRPWFRLVTWDFMNLLPKGEREKYQITCFHIKTLHFICKEWDIMYYFI